MKLLIDTNILLSVLLNQNDHETALEFLDKVEKFDIQYSISEFGMYSAYLLITRRKRPDILNEFISYLEKGKNINIENLKPSDLREIINLKVNLDFDDRVQYYLAKKKNLQLISFDADFDKTDLKRLTPSEALEQLF